MDWKKILDEQLEEGVLMFSFIFLILLVFLQVVSRYIFNFSLGWSEELSRYILIWITWISASYAIRKREHIRITVVKDKLPLFLQKVVELIVILLWFLFVIVMAIEGTKIVQNIQQMGQMSATVGVPMWIIYLILPIGGILMGIRLIQQLYFVFREGHKQ